ncbi:uncharacterized protein LOC121719597 [Alosa sapidissima]|uniref:uncharacterized protein LOC121719597 n=1 Tax=Alosa sapidissima TaxID=34773 RepID=UPI001C09CC8D|nr:uncharacterized protein LOC121719597 [Alosa sapidissima]
MEEEQHDDSSTRPPAKCDSDCNDKPPSRFRSQLEAYKLNQTVCDICLDSVHYARKYCMSCRAAYCARHLNEHNESPGSATHTTLSYVQASGSSPHWRSSVSWTRALIILVVVVAVMVPVFYMSSDDEDARLRALVREQRPRVEKRMQDCEEMYAAVEDQRLLLAKRVCHMQETFKDQRRAMKIKLQEDRQQLESLLSSEQKVFKDLVMPMVESTNRILYSLLENRTFTAGVQKWCDELAKADAVQSS